jgi:hypothetical protein
MCAKFVEGSLQRTCRNGWQGTAKRTTARHHRVVLPHLILRLKPITIGDGGFLNASECHELANAQFPNDYPTESTRTKLLDELHFHRAVQLYLAALQA